MAVGRDIDLPENPDAPLTLHDIVGDGTYHVFEKAHVNTKYYELLVSFWETSDVTQPQLKPLLDLFDRWESLEAITTHFKTCYDALNAKYKTMEKEKKDAYFADFYRAHLLLVQIHEAQFVEAFIKKPTDFFNGIEQSDLKEVNDDVKAIAEREVKKYKDNFAKIHFGELKRQFLANKPTSAEIDSFIEKLKISKLNSDLKTDSLPETQRRNAEIKEMTRRMHNKTVAYPDVFQHEKKAAVKYLKSLIEEINRQLADYANPQKKWWELDHNKEYRGNTHQLLESFPLPVAGTEWLEKLLDESRHDQARKEYYALMDSNRVLRKELQDFQTTVCYLYHQALPANIIEDLRRNALQQIKAELETSLPPPNMNSSNEALLAGEVKSAENAVSNPRPSPRPLNITIPPSSPNDFSLQLSSTPTARIVSSPASPVPFTEYLVHGALDILSPESALTIRMRSWQQSFLKYQPEWYRNLSDRAKAIFWVSIGVVTVGASLTGIGLAVQLSLMWGLGLGFAVCGSGSLILTSKYGKQTQPKEVSRSDVRGSYLDVMSPLSDLKGESQANSIYPSSTLTPSPTSFENSPTTPRRLFDQPSYTSPSASGSKASLSSPRSP